MQNLYLFGNPVLHPHQHMSLPHPFLNVTLKCHLHHEVCPDSFKGVSLPSLNHQNPCWAEMKTLKAQGTSKGLSGERKS